MGNMGGGYGEGEDFDESEDFEGKNVTHMMFSYCVSKRK